MNSGASATMFLPYRCPKFGSAHLRSPCAGKIAEAKALRHKFPGALLGPLEHCLSCEGRNLETREAPISHLAGENDAAARIHGLAIAPPVVENLPSSGLAGPLGPKEGNMEPAASFKGPQAGTPAPPDPAATTIKGQFCKNHPEVESKKNKRGVYMGRCVACLAAVAARNSRNRRAKVDKEKMTPAVARDLGIAPPKVKEQATPTFATFMDKILPADFPGRELMTHPTPLCKNPDCPNPGSAAKIDRLGRSMGLCPACLSARGRKSGIENARSGKTTPPVAIPLNQPKYAELKAWLESQAEELEQSLLQQIMYRLKLAMRGAGGVQP